MMELREVLARLKGAVDNGNGQYMAQCPGHDDKKASLAVRLGDKGIVLHCMAGCDTQDVVRALGLEMKDLFSGDRPMSATKKGQGNTKSRQPSTKKADTATAKPQAPAKPQAAQPKERKAAEEFKPGGHYHAPVKDMASGRTVWQKEIITKVYTYTDGDGNPLMQVARTENKSFPTIHRADGRWWWGDGGHQELLYHLPRVLEGVRDHQRIWLVEGEKDVETLEALGLYATCNKGGAGKWKDGLSEALKGAKVVIVPDLDEAGRKHGRLVARQLEGVAREVRLLNLKKLAPQLPEHGDVSDLADLLGQDAARKRLLEGLGRSLLLSRKVDDSDYAEYYEGVRGFSVQNGCICHWRNESWVPLCNFTALPVEEIVRDDGAGELATSFKVIGWAEDGRRLPEVTMSAETFAAMSWPLKKWGLVAVIRSGNGLKERLREAIQAAGYRSAVRRVSYSHTGWRMIDGKPAYLHGGGGIGCEEAVVELDYGFNRYDLTGLVRGPAVNLGPRERLEYSAGQTLRCLSIAGYRVGAPLVSYMFLSPLRHFLMQEGRRPSFIPFVRGRTGSGKSVIASLILNHFGRDFSYDTAHPASFDDTVNGISLKLFSLKDMPLLIDDYHPEEHPQRRRAMEDVAQRVSRMIGDGARRSRMRNDTTGQEDKPARGLCIQTGEELPRVTESGVARMYVIDLKKGDVPLGDERLTDLQKAARDGALSETMRCYVEWLLGQYEQLPEMLNDRYQELLREAISRVANAHARIPPVVAYLMLGLEMMTRFMVDKGILVEDDMPGLMDTLWMAVLDNTRKQVVEMQDEKPTKMFLDTLRELLDSGRVFVEDIQQRYETKPPHTIGCKDLSYYYLNPGLTYGAVQRAMNDQGTTFPLGKNMLMKLLADEGLIMRDNATGKNVRQLNRGGVRAWVLWMPRKVLDQHQQQEMVIPERSEAQ